MNTWSKGDKEHWKKEFEEIGFKRFTPKVYYRALKNDTAYYKGDKLFTIEYDSCQFWLTIKNEKFPTPMYHGRPTTFEQVKIILTTLDYLPR